MQLNTKSLLIETRGESFFARNAKRPQQRFSGVTTLQPKTGDFPFSIKEYYKNMKKKRKHLQKGEQES